MAGAGQRRRRLPEGRAHQVCVKLSDDEYAKVAAKARVAGVSIPAVLAGRALAWDASQEDGDQRALAPDEVRTIIIELFAVRRGMSNAGRNLNDVARFAHAAGGGLPDGAEAAVAEFRAATERLDAFRAGAQGFLPGVDLSARW